MEWRVFSAASGLIVDLTDVDSAVINLFLTLNSAASYLFIFVMSLNIDRM